VAMGSMPLQHSSTISQGMLGVTGGFGLGAQGSMLYSLGMEGMAMGGLGCANLSQQQMILMQQQQLLQPMGGSAPHPLPFNHPMHPSNGVGPISMPLRMGL